MEKNGIAMRRAGPKAMRCCPLPALTWPAMLEVRLGGEMTYAITTKPEVRAERTAA